MQKKSLSLIILTSFVFILFSCKNSEKITSEKEMRTRQAARDGYTWIQQIHEQKKAAFNGFVEKLPLEEKISQLFIENLEGNTKFRPVEKINTISNKVTTSGDSYIIPGGYLFFSFNVGNTPEQIMEFTASIIEYCKENNRITPFLAIDQEGGYVNRLRKINGPLPSAEVVAKKSSLENAKLLYEYQAQQMNLLGFNMNLAPVAEICTNDNKSFLTERSFGDSQQVIDFGRVCVSSYEKNNIATVLKHFPGNTNTDPHTGLPEITLSKDELFESLIPFTELIKENPSGILMSHARTSACDKDVPACLSDFWVTEILRNQFNYDGIIFSDDIFMGALASNGYSPEKAVLMAIEAGIDCIMISEKKISKPAKVLYDKAINDKAFEKKINQAVARIIKYKMDNGFLTLSETKDGGYEIIPVYKSKFENQIENFYTVKEKNITLYNQNYK